jgi:hypothetical protein
MLGVEHRLVLGSPCRLAPTAGRDWGRGRALPAAAKYSAATRSTRLPSSGASPACANPRNSLATSTSRRTPRLTGDGP